MSHTVFWAQEQRLHLVVCLSPQFKGQVLEYLTEKKPFCTETAGIASALVLAVSSGFPRDY